MALAVAQQAVPLLADENGVMRVGKTRVTLDTLILAFEKGNTAEVIVSQFPVLKLADVYAVISYYLNNQTEIQTYLQQQEEASQKIWERIEARPDYKIFRERLLARKQAIKASKNA